MMAKAIVLLGLVVLLPLVLISWLWAQMLDYYTVPVKYDGPSHHNGDVPPFPGMTSENLWWFIQVS